MRHYYYTICNRKTLYKCLVLYETMKENVADFKFFAISYENECTDLLKQLNTIDLIPICFNDSNEIEFEGDYELANPDSIQGMKLKADAALRLFALREEIDYLLWIDSQVSILSDMQLLYDHLENSSVLLLQNKTNKENEENFVYDYDTTIMAFRNDEVGVAFLKDIVNEQILSDAGSYKKRFEKVTLLPKDNFCIDPPNVKNEDECVHDIGRKGLIIRDKRICWHYFRGFEYFDGNHFSIGNSKDNLPDALVKSLYLPYIKKCKDAVNRIKCVNQNMYADIFTMDNHISNYFNLDINQKPTESAYNFCTICDYASLKPLYNLYSSLNKLNINFRLWVCCLDKSAYGILKNKQLSKLEVFKLNNIIEVDSPVNTAKPIIKYDFMYFILKQNFLIKELLYLEPNYYFLNNPRSIFYKIRESSITIFKDNEAKSSKNKTYMVGVKRDKSTLKLLTDLVNKNRGMEEEELLYFIENSYKAKLQDVGNLNLVDADTRNLRVFLNKNRLIFNKRLIIAVRYAFQIQENKSKNKYIKLRPFKDTRTNSFLKESGLPFIICRHKAI